MSQSAVFIACQIPLRLGRAPEGAAARPAGCDWPDAGRMDTANRIKNHEFARDMISSPQWKRLRKPSSYFFKGSNGLRYPEPQKETRSPGKGFPAPCKPGGGRAG